MAEGINIKLDMRRCGLVHGMAMFSVAVGMVGAEDLASSLRLEYAILLPHHSISILNPTPLTHITNLPPLTI